MLKEERNHLGWHTNRRSKLEGRHRKLSLYGREAPSQEGVLSCRTASQGVPSVRPLRTLGQTLGAGSRGQSCSDQKIEQNIKKQGTL